MDVRTYTRTQTYTHAHIYIHTQTYTQPLHTNNVKTLTCAFLNKKEIVF